MIEEIYKLCKENNEMLKQILEYINKIDSNDYRNTEDIKNLVTNLVANMYINNKHFNNGKIGYYK